MFPRYFARRTSGEPRTDGSQRAFSRRGLPASSVTFPYQEVSRVACPFRRPSSFIPLELPSPCSGGSVSSLSIPTTTLRALSSSNTQRTQSASRRSSGSTIPGGSPTNGSACRLSCSQCQGELILLRHRRKVSLCPIPVPPSRFCVVFYLPRCAERRGAPPPVVMLSSKALALGCAPYSRISDTSPLQTMCLE